MNTYNLYIGSSNLTHELELSKIKAIIAIYFKGYTLQKVSGVWEGKAENTAMVTIATDEKSIINKLAGHLKTALKQDAIMVQLTGTALFV